MSADGLTISRLASDASGSGFDIATFRAGAGSPGHAVLVPSGALGPWSEATPAAEAWVDLARRLTERGLGATLFDVPRRRDRSVPADAAERAERCARLQRTIRHLERSGTRVTALVGLSLGAETILETLATPDGPRHLRRVVLASHVIDRPTPVMVPVEEVWLVYGGLDGVAYVDSGTVLEASSIEVERPELYGPRSAAQLILLPAARRRLAILEGCRHDLGSVTDPDAGPSSLAPLLVEADGVSAGLIEHRGDIGRGTMDRSSETLR